MSNRGFWRGVLTGGVIGAALAWCFGPQMKPEMRKRWSERGNKLAQEVGRRARGVWRRTRQKAEDMVEEQMR